MADADAERASDQEARRLRAATALADAWKDADDPRLSRLTRLAARLFEAPRAALLLIEADHIRLAGRVGHAANSISRETPLADIVLRCSRSSQHAAVAGTAFLACAPLRDPRGLVVGVLAVEDDAPRADDPGRLDSLAELADLAIEELIRGADQARAEAERLLDGERLALALGAARLGEFEWNIKTDRIRISERMARISGIPAGDIPAEEGKAIWPYVHPEDREITREDLRAQLRESGRYEVEYRRALSPGGREQWSRGCGVMVLDGESQPDLLIGVVQDITDQREADERRDNLVAELDHRIKNLLAVVQSVAAQSARKSSSLDAFLKTFAARLKSMSSAHDLISAARWRGATLGRIAAAELGGLAPNQTRWDGPELFLTPRAAAALSLALHELAVNAVKYGSLSTEAGRVEIVWRRSPDGGFSLEWLETGGPTTSPPTNRGFGTTLVEDVVGRELGGEAKIDYRRSGVSAMIHAAPAALADGPEPEPAEVEPERIVETIGGGDENFRAGAIAGLKVLIVEDSLLLAMELEAGLEDSGVQVVGCAAELSEALAMLEQDFDAAVLDADLNGQSVAPVAEVLRKEGRPFVFATGYADKAAPMGFDAPIVRKPYNVHQIARALASVTGRG
ncbi:HWE histidine kinase domain-containing protein [Caulobacter hibisci]|uniref:histidine kinase n=1 Tax=Caulobacter hibisci TaxID=2035993 RepID=A0ABS0SV95_9CAUL|nr:HWE histidine kinase domain-containing protein [Caulobacter hibisci]MBI1683324.1 PAS domain-containing protein [Caulobacter hibisci]